MDTLELLHLLNGIMGLLFALCYAYQFFYLAVPFLKKDKPLPSGRGHRYAILIAARNEEAVIGHLLDSIQAQTYPQDKITVFVLADNCTDHTAGVARDHGAVVYQRFDTARVGKGYALECLLTDLRRDYPPFDGYAVFDADNLLAPDYLEQVDRTVSQGYEIVTTYRNSKNFADNWISAGYGLWFLREAAFLNHPRMLLGTSCAVSGTGFCFSHRVLEHHGGWPFHLLTEDIEFTIASILSGFSVGYCKDAVFYDEQPVAFGQSWRQRLRWAKGYLQVFRQYGGELLRGSFRRCDFACFDMTMAILPAMVLSLLSGLCTLASGVLLSLTGQSVIPALLSLLRLVGQGYLLLLFLGGLTTLTQWKQIRATTGQKLWYTLTFPVFMLTYLPISLCALFQRVEWKPIEHRRAMSLREMERQ